MNTAVAISDASVWHSKDFPSARQWAKPLTAAMLDEIYVAINNAKSRRLAPWRITRADFPLPTTAPLLANALHDLEYGPGFAVLSGFPVERYDYDDNLIAFCGICSYLGDIVEQTGRGEFLIDVIDKGLPYDHQTRGYSSNKRLPFHTDGAHIAGLLCVDKAAHGGHSLIASATAIYNELLHTRPDLLVELMRGFHHHRRGEQPAGESSVSPSPIPVFSFYNSLLHACYNRNPIEWAQRESGVPALSERQIEALDYLDTLANRADFQLAMDLQRGDMQFVNNFVILHSRTDYQDDNAHKRHLVRIWLNAPDSRRHGPSLLDLYTKSPARFQQQTQRETQS